VIKPRGPERSSHSLLNVDRTTEMGAGDFSLGVLLVDYPVDRRLHGGALLDGGDPSARLLNHARRRARHLQRGIRREGTALDDPSDRAERLRVGPFQPPEPLPLTSS
jgi:hypothetical protein